MSFFDRFCRKSKKKSLNELDNSKKKIFFEKKFSKFSKCHFSTDFEQK